MRAITRLRTTGGRVAKRIAHPRSKQVLREMAFLAARRMTTTMAVRSHGSMYYVDTRDMVLSRLLFMHGNRDADDLRAALRVLAAKTSGEFGLQGRDFVDVGANIGTTTIPAVTQFDARRSIGFEPSPRNFELLRHAILANHVEDSCSAYQLALSDRPGQVHLALSGYNLGDHRVAAANGGVSDRDEILVRSETLDTLVTDGTLDAERIGLLWIDVQGHEGHVLAGACQLLKARVPVHIEFWPEGLRASGGFDRLCGLVAEHYRSVIELGTLHLGEIAPTEHEPAALPRLAEALPGERYTNLLLLP